LLSIPFYREKLRENSIDLHEVRRIDTIGKLDAFLQKCKVNWVEGEDLIKGDFSSHLSLVPKNKRTWVQYSSGYMLVERLRKGEIRITSPFEGTTLIDYAPGDVTKLLSYNSTIEFRGWRINLPYALLSYDIRRSHESSYVKIREYPMSLPILNEILASHCSYDDAIFKSRLKDELVILVPENIKGDNFDEICQKIRYIAYPPIYGLIRVKKVKEEKLRRIIYTNIHHKPHNIILEPSQQLEEEINAL